MRRDIGNEILVALVAAGALAFGVAAAIILSIAGASGELALTETAAVATDIGATAVAGIQAEPTTPIANASATRTNITVTSAETTASPVNTAPAPTTTSAGGAAESATRQPSISPTRITPTATFSPTTIPPTRTPLPPSPTATLTSSPTATESASPTATNTVTLTARPSATPTNTRTATVAPTVTRTPSLTPTDTLAPPTRTALPSRTPVTVIPTRTATATITVTLTRTPHPTTTPAPTARTPLPSNTPVPTRPTQSIASPSPAITSSPTDAIAQGTLCPPPAGWKPYIVKRGDTLTVLARLTGATVAEIQAANCLDDPNAIKANTTIFLPESGAPPVAVSPTVIVIAKEGCDYPGAVISQPETGASLSGEFELIGSAYVPDFWYYQLEIRTNNAAEFVPIRRLGEIVIEGTLAKLNTGDYGRGLFWIRLRVVDKNGNIAPTCAIPLIFQ